VQEKVIKVDLNQMTVKEENKKSVIKSTDRDRLINTIYNTKMIKEKDNNYKVTNRTFSPRSNKAQRTDTLTQITNKIMKKKASTTLLKKQPYILKRSTMSRNNSSQNVRQGLITNKVGSMKRNYSTVNNSNNINIFPKNNDEIKNKIINEVFKVLDEDADNKISLMDLKEERISSTILRILSPLNEKLQNNETIISKDLFTFLCQDIYTNLSRVNKVSLIDWYMDHKSKNLILTLD